MIDQATKINACQMRIKPLGWTYINKKSERTQIHYVK